MKCRIVKDVHNHIMEVAGLGPDDSFEVPGMENAENMFRFIDELGWDAVNIPAITLDDARNIPCNYLSLYAKVLGQREGKDIYALAGLQRSPKAEDNKSMAEDARYWISLGFDGFKMICKPNVRRTLKFGFSDPVFEDFYAEAERNSWPILFHIGDPIEFWDRKLIPDWAMASGWYYGDDKDIPSMTELYTEMENVLSKFPKLNVTFAHFLFLSFNIPYAQRLFDAYPNIKLDVTPGSEMYLGFTKNYEVAKAFFENNAGRILFGTDNTSVGNKGIERSLSESREKVETMFRFFECDDEFDGFGLKLKGLKLSKHALEELYHGSFEKFFGYRRPSFVDSEKLVSAAEKQCQKLGMDMVSLQNKAILEKLAEALK